MELTEEFSLRYTEISNNLENVIKEIDDIQKSALQGFNEIQSLIEKQRQKFETPSHTFEKTVDDIAAIENGLEPEDDEQFDDIKQTDSENEDTITDICNDLMQMSLPKDVKEILGDCTQCNHKKHKHLNRDLTQITPCLHDLNETNRKYAQLSVLKYYNILCEIFERYCIIGGDSDWLNIQGWHALCKDAFIDTDIDKDAIFRAIYDEHTHEYDGCNDWDGIWHGIEQFELKLKRLGHNKLIGFINRFDFCDINGSIDDCDTSKSQCILFWHKGPRRGTRRRAICDLSDSNEMKVKWESINTVSIKKKTYTMTKKKQLSTSDAKLFKDKMGLARYQYFDALLVLSKKKYPQLDDKLYQCLCRLCEHHLIPFIYSSFPSPLNPHNTKQIKALFKRNETQLHQLFDKYNCIDTNSTADQRDRGALLALDEWTVLCFEILSRDKNAFNNGGKPTNNDIAASFELAKERDVQLTYKGFTNALVNLAQKMYKPKPKQKQKYHLIAYEDKLKQLLQWAVKLQKSGRSLNRK